MALHNAHSTPLLGEKDIEHNNTNGVNTILSKPTKKSIFLIISFIVAVTLIVSSFVYVSFNGRNIPMPHENNDNNDNTPLCASSKATTVIENKIASRGVEEGVSAKSNGQLLLGTASCVWTNRMLGWQRTSFHFQAPKNWINDPNGPVFYKGYYHLFYQYNPEGPIWGNIVWGHAISKDLINWRHLPLAMETDQWYDINGVWTGSATILPDGQLVMLYTGSTNQSVQVQNLAYPADPSDPFLTKWVKYSGNPVLVPPPGIDDKDFRDPTTAWITSEGKWRITIGSKINKTGLSLVYDTLDFKNFELKNQVLHAVPRTGMWECVDFYPVSKNHQNGLDTSYNGPDVKHVVKVSLDDTRYDTYAIGTYNDANGTWVPDDYTIDVGIGLRYDYGIFYASKTFYDQEKQRRILWGWIKETDSELADFLKGWASLMDIPRTVVLDEKTGTNLVQWPVEELEQLRKEEKVFNNVLVKPGGIVSLDISSATQLDIEAEFEIDNETLSRVEASDAPYSCSSSDGAQQRGVLGPFGLSILSSKDLTEQTPVYFYITKTIDGNFNTHFCSDQSRSSLANDVDKSIYGSTVPVLKGEKLTMRILVDHSIVESFAQRGRTCITSRVYPTIAIYEEAALFLFNNATNASVIASLKIWQMTSAQLHF